MHTRCTCARASSRSCVHTCTYVTPICLQKCVEDFSVQILEDLARDIPGGLSGHFPKKGVGKNRQQDPRNKKNRKQSILRECGPDICTLTRTRALFAHSRGHLRHKHFGVFQHSPSKSMQNPARHSVSCNLLAISDHKSGTSWNSLSADSWVW